MLSALDLIFFTHQGHRTDKVDSPYMIDFIAEDGGLPDVGPQGVIRVVAHQVNANGAFLGTYLHSCYTSQTKCPEKLFISPRRGSLFMPD